jgi:hypothetical protein
MSDNRKIMEVKKVFWLICPTLYSVAYVMPLTKFLLSKRSVIAYSPLPHRVS